ncbi:unnamed protein product [Pedinophyceae sp. YPF-701]|nr:unnamed protein product [Pedinophyceae sp. YPF-701]
MYAPGVPPCRAVGPAQRRVGCSGMRCQRPRVLNGAGCVRPRSVFSAHRTPSAPQGRLCALRAIRSSEDEWAAGGSPYRRNSGNARGEARGRRERPRLSKSALAKQRKGHCYGCGIALQVEAPAAPGYVEREKYETKRRHKQLDQILCTRCVALSQGSMVPAVKDFSTSGPPGDMSFAETPLATRGGSLDSGRTIAPEQLREELRHVRGAYALTVMVVDLLDAQGSFMGKVRDLVGPNPLLLVGTKADLLPRGTDLREVSEWLLDLAEAKGLQVVGVELVSSRTREGVEDAVSAILRARRGRDVYVLGSANVGKSALVRAMLVDLASFHSRNFDANAIGATKNVPMESPMPGTTLSLIPIRAFSSGGVLFDSPGLHLHHRLPHILTPEELKLLHPTRRLRAFVAAPVGSVGPGIVSYLWGGLLRIDVDAGDLRDTRLAFFGPRAMIAQAMEYLESPGNEDVEDRLDLYGTESADKRGGLRVAREATVRATGSEGALADLACSGLPGWISIFSPGARGSIRVRIWAPRGIEAYVRPPLPVPSPLGPSARANLSPQARLRAAERAAARRREAGGQARV